jgi:hypothetical protein
MWKQIYILSDDVKSSGKKIKQGRRAEMWVGLLSSNKLFGEGLSEK